MKVVQIIGGIVLVAVLAESIKWRRSFESDVIRIIEDREMREVAQFKPTLDNLLLSLNKKPSNATNMAGLLQGYFTIYDSFANELVDLGLLR